MKRSSVVMIAAAALLCGASHARAHGPMGGDRASELIGLAEKSNLVFVGQVSDVKYKNAKIEGGEGTLPFTVVTYSVGEVLRGQSPGDTFTMRFPGGSDGQGGFVEVSGVPLFQPGEKDLLFVRSNGDEGCALVECEWGRFRIHKDAVYNAHGSPVRGLGRSRAVSRGLPPEELRKFRYPAPSFDDLMKNPNVKKQLEALKLSEADARKRYEQEAPKEIELRTVFSRLAQSTADALSAEESAKESAVEKVTSTADAKSPLPAVAAAAQVKLGTRAVGLDQFLSAVKGVVGKAKRKPIQLRSTDPKEDIVVKLTGPKVPPKLEAPKAVSAATPEEEAEIKALRAQDFNPVLKKK